MMKIYESALANHASRCTDHLLQLKTTAHAHPVSALSGTNIHLQISIDMGLILYQFEQEENG
jgi:hypothetical protein